VYLGFVLACLNIYRARTFSAWEPPWPGLIVTMTDTHQPAYGVAVTARDEKAAASATIQPQSDTSTHSSNLTPAPLRWKIMAILLITAIGFGSHWSSGITGAMKSTIKKEMKVNNKQFAVLEASEDFMVTALMLASGLVTDRIGGAGMYGPALNALLHVADVCLCG
jgi:hypothetical protein